MGFRNKTQGPDFFEDFTSQARQLVQAVEFLTHIYAASPEERIALRDQLHEVEHRGDELNHDIVQRINSSFITPFDREAIAKMKDGVVFIDNARGELMDIDAVTEAVESGKFGALFMDAFPGETGIIHVPHDEDIIRTPGMPYFKLKYLRSFVNVYHTPHMAFFTEEAAEQMAECGVNSIYEILTEGKSKHEIPC